MADFDCPVGMFITQDESGDYVPFLLQVRDKEIIWDMDKFSIETVNAINNMKPDVVSINYPLPSYRILKDGWNIVAHYDGTIEAQKEIKFNDSALTFTSLKPTNDVYRTTIELPFKLGEFSTVNTTFNASNDNMLEVEQSITIIRTDFGNISGFHINLISLTGSEITNFSSASVYVSIKGKIAYE